MLVKGLVFFSLFLSTIIGSEASAHTVSYQDANALMISNSSDMSQWVFNHSFTSKFSAGANYIRMEGTDAKREYYMGQANFLLKRWNELKSQGNLYLSFGQGMMKKNDDTSNASMVAVEADWESRKYYVAFMHEAFLNHKSSKDHIYMTKLRGGFAPYLADFNELNTWVILELKNISKMSDDIIVTPIVRLFYNNVLMEFGISSKGSSEFNFMVHF